MTELIIPFILREDKEREIKENLDHCNLQSNNIIIRGDSGCGKTSLIKKVLKEYVSNPEFFVIYLDLNADLLSTSSFFEIFLFNVWNPIESNEDPLMSISEKQSFKSFITRKMWKKGAAKRLFQLVVESISAIPAYGSTLSKLIMTETSEKSVNNNVID
ncbi:ATP-binding protein, partial [Paenibacillus sp. P46E]|uniref:ATP-binding protein n=1 Tax=Paenibacillus sp. P46E TaxID=1349436 RepID=UPI000A6174ED